MRVSIWRRPQAILAALAYVFLGFAFVVYEEVFPLYMTATIDVGGLAFSSAQVRACASVSGVIVAAYV
jgi:hypothetical protein